MAHLHSETINGKNVIFYTDDTGIIWIRTSTTARVRGKSSITRGIPPGTWKESLLVMPGISQVHARGGYGKGS